MGQEYYYSKRNANRPANYYDDVKKAYYGKDMFTGIVPLLEALFTRWGFKGQWGPMSSWNGYGAEVWYQGRVISSFSASDKLLVCMPNREVPIYIYRQCQAMLADAILIRAEKEGRV